MSLLLTCVCVKVLPSALSGGAGCSKETTALADCSSSFSYFSKKKRAVKQPINPAEDTALSRLINHRARSPHMELLFNTRTRFEESAGLKQLLLALR